MANYDDVIEKNKRYLTNAQVNALVAASKEYNIQNAGNRAGALASAREQYDTGYRGLQNMGLAGGVSAAPTSGEVPRLKAEVQAPFDAYNNRLKQVENMRLNALGGQMAESTRRARAAAAAQQAAAAAAAAAKAREERRISAGLRQTDMEATGRSGSTINSDPKRQRNVNMTDTASNGERAAAARTAQAQQKLDQNQSAQVRDFRAASNPEVTTQEQMAVRAAAEVLGVGNKNTTTQSTGFFKKNGTVNQTETKQTASQNTEGQKAEDTRQSFVLNPAKIDRATMQSLAGTPAQRQQRIVYAQSVNVLNTGKGYDTDSDQQALAEAQNTLDNMKWRQHYGGKVDSTDYKNAKDQVEILKLKVEHPDLYAALVVYNNEDARNTPEHDKAADVIAKEEAKALVKQVYGRDIDTSMTFDEYENAGKNLKEIKTLVARLDYAEKTLDVAKKNKMLPETIAEDQALVDSTIADIENLGYTVDQARNLATNYAQERDVRTELEYYTNAFKADMLYSGKMPIHDINDEETDVTYRAVNDLPDLMRWVYYLPGTMANSALTYQAASRGGAWGRWMTQDQKNAYNYLYDKKGIKAANEYLDSIRPLINIQHAQEDAEYAKELVNDSVGSAILANLASVPIRSAGSIPAVLEKLIVGGLNAASDLVTGGAGSKYYIDTNSPANQLANFASTIRSETSQRIIEENQDNPTIANVANRAYQIGMSTADSAFNMAFGIAGPKWLTGLLASSDAANEAYKDARARGGTQEQAIALSTLNGIAEALFETVSLEFFTNQWIEKGAAWTRPFIVKLGLGSAVEGSEEVNTAIANLLSDVYVMHDKSEWKQLIQEKGMKQAFYDTAKDIGGEGLAGAISGGIFGLFGGAFNGVRSYAETTSIGKQAQSLGLVQKYEDMATVLGGKAEKAAAKVESKETAHNVGKMVGQVNQQLSQAFTGNEQTDIPMALLFSGKQLSFTEANDVYQALGSEKLEKMGYKADSARSFMSSYNDRMVESGIYARTQEQLKESQKNTPSAEAEEYLNMTDQLAGTEYNEKNVAQNKAMREALEKRVWKNPNVGVAVTDDGTEVPAMPGNMTRVGWAEMNRKNFKAQSTVTKGRTTYELSSMAMREGMTNEEAYAAMRENMQEGAKKSADFYENIANSLGLDIVVHDVMRGSNGFLQDGKLHVVLSSRQNAVRIASHELTHYIKAHSPEKFTKLQQHLIGEVGQKEFNRMVANKAALYGFDTKTQSGLANAREEVCAELCERMLSNDQMLSRFAQRETDTARAMKSHLEKTVDAIHKALTGNDQRDFGNSDSKLIKAEKTLDSWIDGLTDAIANAEAQKNTMEGQIASVAGVTVADQTNLVSDLSEAENDDDLDEVYNAFSVDVIEYDMAGYMQDLADAGVMTAKEIDDLYDTMNAAINTVKAHRAILDYGTELTTEEEIQEAKRGRAYMPYKQNADPHYKLALDFSTLCRKRVLLQTIQERLQAKLGRALSQEETVAVRLELQKLQREGYKVEVACALCYVEAARLKSPKVINTFLNNTEAEMRNYFAQKNPASKNIILGMQQQWKVDHGYAPDTTKKQMSSADVAAFNTYSRSIREQFESDHPAEQVTIQRAIDLANDKRVMIGGITFPGRETFLSASWLTKLKSVEPDIFNAFTDKVRSATHSKAQETDTFYSRGDIDMVTESILNYANAESGFRHQSWSDFVPTHLLDTMAAVIEMSTRKAKMHAYTKVPSMVEFLGKSGMMLNMSLIPAGDTGLNVDGSLAFDPVEGMPWDTMMELRDMFPETAGNIAIGINDEQIQKMLASKDIDYVIPYHASGMNKNMRGYLDIRAWSEYTSSQNEKTNHRGTKGAAPELAEWFDEKAAAKATDGEAFMREASEKYLKLCYERNLIPKFSQYLTNNGDGSYSLKEGYENYWKMLTDRKMVNQVTGNVIIQQAVKPTFDQATVLGILEDRLHDPAIQDAAEAADIVTEKLSDWQANRNNASAEAIQEAKNIRDRTAAITAQKTAEAMHSIDDEYMDIAEDYTAGKATPEQTKALEQDVEKAAKLAGYNSPKLYHGTTAFGFTKFDLAKGGGLIFASSNRNTASTYSGETDRTRIKDRFTGDVDALRGDELIQTANEYLDNRYEGFDLITDAQKKEYADRIRRTIDESIKKGERYVNAFNDVSSDEKEIAVMDRLLDSLLEIRSAETQTELQHAYDQWDRGLVDLRFIDEDTCDEFMKQCKASKIGMICQRYLRALLYSGDIYGYVDGDTLSFRYDNTIKVELDSELRRGIYSLYGKLGRNLEIDANGAYWDEITAPEELHMDGMHKTRAVAEKAFSLGYDSITIKNLKDNGGQTGYQGAGDIYIFNAENAVKSADPVTYDGNGNIIPLSERFRTDRTGDGSWKNKDIRYSIDEETSESAQYSAETIEQLEGVSEFLDQITKGDQQLREKLISALMPVIEQKVATAEKRANKPVRTAQNGMKPAGRQPRVRDVQVPQYAKTGNPVSDFARSFLESDKATDEMVADLQEKIENGEWGSYARLTNKEAMDQAKDFISRRTLSKAQEEFHDMVKSGRYNVGTRAIGLQLLAEAAQRGDSEAVLNIATDLRELATDAGQSVQIFNVLKGLGGFGSAWYMQKKIDALNTKYADQIAAGKMNEITVSKDLMQNLMDAKSTVEVEAAEDEIAKEIAKQLPLTWESRIANWRYLAMLGNPTTHFRNITGNVFMAGLNTTKDAVASGIERLAVKDTGKRAHALLTMKDRQTWGRFAEQSYKDQEKALRGNGKFGFETQLRQYMRSFDTKWLNKIAQFNFDKLEQEDMWFIKPAYQNALMQYMKAQGFQLKDGVAGKIVDGKFKEVTTDQMNAAREWASQQAWKATFHDASVVADMLNNASRKLGPVGNVLIEGVMPFKKTPINIAKRGIEYSPAGIIMGAVQLMKDVNSGKVTTAQAIDNIASGITGTALMALGAFLAKLGLLRSGGEDKKKKETYLTDTGDQTYSLKLGKLSIGLSALAPATIPLFIGAALYDALDKNGEGLDLSAATETVANALNPFMEMSFMSSLNSALKNYNQNGIGGALGNTLLTAAESYGSQFLPTAVAKAGQVFDPINRTTKSSAASPVGSGLDYYARSLAKKVPGLEATLQPDVDVWGRTNRTFDSFGKWALDFANKFIFPVNVKVANKDAVDDELIRVVESTGDVDVLPSDGPKYFTVKGEKYPMTAAQYTEYSQERGQASYAALKETMSADSYWDATDEEKANMLSNALTAAQKHTDTVWKEKLGAIEPEKEEITEEKPKTEVQATEGEYSDPALYKVAASYPNAYDRAAKAKAKGISPDTFLDLYEKKDTYSGDDLSTYTREEIMKSDLTPRQKEFMDDLIVSDKGWNPDYSSQAWFEASMLGNDSKTRQKHYEEAKEGAKIGLIPETYVQVYNKWKSLSGNTKQHDAKAYLDSLTITAPVYDYLWYTVFGYKKHPSQVK